MRSEHQLLRVDQSVKHAARVLESQVPCLDKFLNQRLGPDLESTLVDLVEKFAGV